MVIVAVVASTLFGCSTHPTVYSDNGAYMGREVVVTEAPPPVVLEARAGDPRPGYVWVEGGWVWRDRRWVWERGHWIQPPHHTATWVSGHYYYRNGRHVYVPGHWTR